MGFQELFKFLSIFFSGLLAAVLFKRFFFPRIEAYVSRTNWEGNRILLSALKRWVLPFAIFLSLFVSLDYLPLGAESIVVIRKTVLVLFIFCLTGFFAQLFGEALNSYLKAARIDIPSVSIFGHITKWVIFAIGFLIVLNSLGISISPILTGLGIGGLAVALALQETLSNLFSGLHILASRQIRPGDYIRLETGEEGYVVDVTWRNTVIRELPNNLIIVPNSKLAKTIVRNYHMPEKELSVLFQLGVSFDSDLEKVEAVTTEVAKEVLREVRGGVSDFEPVIRYHTFSDFSINFTVILRAKEFTDQYLLKHEFIKRLHKRYRDEGIVIPFPVRTVFLKGREYGRKGHKEAGRKDEVPVSGGDLR